LKKQRKSSDFLKKIGVEGTTGPGEAKGKSIEKRSILIDFARKTGVEAATGTDEATRKSMEKPKEIIGFSKANWCGGHNGARRGERHKYRKNKGKWWILGGERGRREPLSQTKREGVYINRE